jgi:hypothetical protein
VTSSLSNDAVADLLLDGLTTFINGEEWGVIEARVLDVKAKFGQPVYSGFYDADHLKKMAMDCALLERRGGKLYFTINPGCRDLLAVCNNRIDAKKGQPQTTDKDIIHRRRLLIDVDPRRRAGVSATDAEKDFAKGVAVRVRNHLHSLGFPLPLTADSGNGFHLFYSVDLPADDGELIKNFLRSLDAKFSTAEAAVDTSVFNASRIVKIPGSLARKGDSVPERPHRRSCLKTRPKSFTVVPLELIEQVAAEAPPGKTSVPVTHKANGMSHSATPASSDVIKRASAYVAKMPPAIQGEQGSGKLLNVCAKLRLGFDLTQDQAWPIMANEYNPRCEPPWSDRELMHKWDEAAKCDDVIGGMLKASSTSTTSAPSNSSPGAATTESQEPGAEDKQPLFTFIDSRTFANAEYVQRFLVKNILVQGQPALIGGRSKTLKTSIGIDLLLSITTGTAFLGQFETMWCPAGFISGESGAFTIRETALRIAEAKGINLADAAAYWEFTLPQVGRPGDLDALGEVIQKHELKVCFLDPAYLSLLAGDTEGVSTSNVFHMGPLLGKLTTLGTKTDCTVILVHHCRKTLDNPYAPPELEDLSMAGFAEWGRQWLLIGRREEYQQGTGRHRLWMNVGGSAGHSGLHAIDIDEGVIDENFQGRNWDVGLRPVADVRAEKKKRTEEKKAEQEKFRDKNQIENLISALRQFPNGETVRILRETAGLNLPNCTKVIEMLLEEGRIEPAKILKNKRQLPGYKLTESQ